MYRTYADRVAFLFVYIREAHASDEWQMPSNEKEDVVFTQPTTWSARRNVAQLCCQRLRIDMPTVVDTIDNEVDTLYAGWPERMFVITADAKIAYVGEPGPWGFKPEEVEEWLRKNVGRTDPL